MVNYWTQFEAIELAALVERIAPQCGAHVALTGGCLYKKGPRKDCDLLFYKIRNWEEINETQLLDELVRMGFEIDGRFGWVIKAHYQGRAVDLFLPESLHNEENTPEEYRDGG